MITKQEFIAFGRIVDATIEQQTLELESTVVTRLTIPPYRGNDDSVEVEWYSPTEDPPTIRATNLSHGPSMTITGRPKHWTVDQTADDGNLLTELKRTEQRSALPIATISKYGPPADFGPDGIELFPYEAGEPDGEFILEDILADMEDES